jgi:uncharacterized membrane protein YccC
MQANDREAEWQRISRETEAERERLSSDVQRLRTALRKVDALLSSAHPGDVSKARDTIRDALSE